MSLTPQDMDRDGDLDVVFSDRKGARTGVFYLENPGAKANREHAAWKEHAIGALNRQVMFADLADVNGDGLLDVAVAVKPLEVVLCLQQPGGGWQEQIISLDAAQLGTAKAVKAADVNGDGLMDFSSSPARRPKGSARESSGWSSNGRGLGSSTHSAARKA